MLDNVWPPRLVLVDPTCVTRPEATGIGEYDPAARAEGWAEDLVGLLGDALYRAKSGGQAS